MAEEEARRKELAPALANLTGASHAIAVVLDLYSIGNRPVLDAVSCAIGDTPLGRAYLSGHIHEVKRRGTPAPPPWRDQLRHTLMWERQRGIAIWPHSPSMTCLRFMLAREGFARLVKREGFAKLFKGVVTIEPTFQESVRIALQALTTQENP
jgi:hypothetical protein